MALLRAQDSESTAQTDTSLVAAVSDRKIEVVAGMVSAAAAQKVTFKRGSTAVAVVQLGTAGTVLIPADLIFTDQNEALTWSSTVATQTDIHLVYRLVEFGN